MPDTHSNGEAENVSPLSLLFSESEDEGDVKRVTVTDHGSCPQFVRVDVQGVIDTVADVTIMLFALVASSARLPKKDFKPLDRVPRNLTTDGRMELEISFQGKAMKTAVYIKMDVPDQLQTVWYCHISPVSVPTWPTSESSRFSCV